MRRIKLRLILMAGCASSVVAQVPEGGTSIATVIKRGADNFFTKSEAGMLSPAARISFYGTRASQLCVVVAAKRGRGGILKSFFSFRRFLTAGQGATTVKLKFKFAKGVDSASGSYSMWNQCLAGESRDPVASQDVLEVTIRRPGQEPTSFSIINPRVGRSRGIDIREDAYGHMSSRRFVEEFAAD